MDRRSWLVQILTVGTISGLLLGSVLYIAQRLSGDSVFTLLMNVDYIPVLRQTVGILWIEWVLHLIVSVVLTGVIWTLYPRLFRSMQVAKAWIVGTAMVIGLLLFPSTVLSDRTPAIQDASAWFWWMLAHFIYGLVLMQFYQIYQTHQQAKSKEPA
ncbi:hypothetical protein [Marinicrinis sediminis]|uniref:Uncharacterized protein n=1 Tax=Marinicrinis sediminis TaxID=1652465 RepID=A0ABW5R5U4_9BACL